MGLALWVTSRRAGMVRRADPAITSWGGGYSGGHPQDVPTAHSRTGLLQGLPVWAMLCGTCATAITVIPVCCAFFVMSLSRCGCDAMTSQDDSLRHNHTPSDSVTPSCMTRCAVLHLVSVAAYSTTSLKHNHILMCAWGCCSSAH